MKVLSIHKPGGFERLKLEERPEPECGATQVKIAVSAAGVNYADCVIRKGLYKSARELVGYPITPGFEVAGTVTEVGQLVSTVRVGQRVFAPTLFGGYATTVVVPESHVFETPERFSDVQAATFPAVFLTAWYALCEQCRLRAGYQVLVHSAAGGVGSAATQIAKLHGCRVAGVVRGEHKVNVAREQGADCVIDKSSDDLWARAAQFAPEGYDVVLDPNGVETLMQSFTHLRPTGRLVIYGFSTMFHRGRGRPSYPKLVVDYLRTPRFDPLRMVNANKSVMAFNLSYLFSRSELLAEAKEELLGWVGSGKLEPLRVREFSFADASEAHRAIESGTTVGKLALIP